MTDAPEAKSTEADVPAFARDYPRDPELDALVAAFSAGDYARVRADAPKLAARTGDDGVRNAAVDLRARTGSDPLAKALLAFTLALLVALGAWWVAHSGPKDGPTAPPERSGAHT